MSNLGPDVVAELARIKRQRIAREHGAEGVAPDVEGSQNKKPETKPESLKWLDMSKWDDEPVPERKWAIKDRVPINQAGLFSGEGGTGKSIIELMKDIAHVAGKDWLGSTPERGPAFYIGAEDALRRMPVRSSR
jgi:RecA-family ATPase